MPNISILGLRCSGTAKPEEQSDEDQRRSKANQKVQPHWRAWLGVRRRDQHIFGLQQGQQRRIAESGYPRVKVDTRGGIGARFRPCHGHS